MSINPQIDNDRVLRNSSGNTIGKVDFDGEVRDGYHSRGHVNNDGRYIDEYGRDHGWTVPGKNSSSSDGGSLAGAAVGVGMAVAMAAMEPTVNLQCPNCGGYGVKDYDALGWFGQILIHEILAIFTLGLWLIVFLIMAVQGRFKRPKDGSHRYSCEKCGYKWQQMPPAKKK